MDGSRWKGRLSGGLRALHTHWRTEPTVLLIVGLTAGALLGFVQVVDEVIEGEARAVDERVLRALRDPADPADPIGPWWIEVVFRDVTALGGAPVLTLVTLGTLGYLLIEGRRPAALLVAISTGGGALVSHLLKGLFARPRPEQIGHLVDVRTLSFPSGHAMLSAVTFLTLGALLARIQTRRRQKVYLLSVAVLLTLLVGVSRVYLGVHWPTDVVAGWCVGAAWAMVCWLAALWVVRRGRPSPAEQPAEQAMGRSPEG